MARKFDIPIYYKSPIISSVKNFRRATDHRKIDLTPSVIDTGPVIFKVARHFGFCFGVENAIEIAYRALNENPGKRVFLLSEMIHNPHVNGDLVKRGVRFLRTPEGENLIDFNELTPNDIVIVPAFGTTVELFEALTSRGINPALYNATCPFVEKVWKRARELGERGYTIVIHGKHSHEETRATFSHARISAPSLVIRDMTEANTLYEYITGERPPSLFSIEFEGRFSDGFDPLRDLTKIGVVNQTTMLATETIEISRRIREATVARFGNSDPEHFADTGDTLCYATSENQDSIGGLLRAGGDIAIVVGGYNSSNTSHLVELLERVVPTFYVKDAGEILSKSKIRHLNLHTHKVQTSSNWLPVKSGPIEILLTAGASCPDALVDEVIQTVAELFGVRSTIPEVIKQYETVMTS